MRLLALLVLACAVSAPLARADANVFTDPLAAAAQGLELDVGVHTVDRRAVIPLTSTDGVQFVALGAAPAANDDVALGGGVRVAAAALAAVGDASDADLSDADGDDGGEPDSPDDELDAAVASGTAANVTPQPDRAVRGLYHNSNNVTPLRAPVAVGPVDHFTRPGIHRSNARGLWRGGRKATFSFGKAAACAGGYLAEVAVPASTCGDFAGKAVRIEFALPISAKHASLAVAANMRDAGTCSRFAGQARVTVPVPSRGKKYAVTLDACHFAAAGADLARVEGFTVDGPAAVYSMSVVEGSKGGACPAMPGGGYASSSSTRSASSSTRSAYAGVSTSTRLTYVSPSPTQSTYCGVPSPTYPPPPARPTYAPVRTGVLDNFTRLSNTNNYGYWRGGLRSSFCLYRAGAPGGGWVGEVAVPHGTCGDFRGRAVQFEFSAPATAGDNVQFTVAASMRDKATCGAYESQARVTLTVPKCGTRYRVVVDACRFERAGADLTRVEGFTFEGPITLYSVSIITGQLTCPRITSSSTLTSRSTTSSSTTVHYPTSTSTSVHVPTTTSSVHYPTATTSASTTVSIPTHAPQPPAPSCAAYPPHSAPLPPAAHFVPRTDLPTPYVAKNADGLITRCGWNGVFAPTWDDGPHPEHTLAVLRHLAVANVQGTFFVAGQMMQWNAAAAQAIHSAGHLLASHSHTHADLTTLDAAGVRREVTESADAIALVTGGKRPRFFRPPYGVVNPSVMQILEGEFGMRVVGWSLDPEDWRDDATADSVMNYYHAELAKDSASSTSHIALNHDLDAVAGEVAPRLLQAAANAGYAVLPVHVCLNEKAYFD